jgi:hypothetical protein
MQIRLLTIIPFCFFSLYASDEKLINKPPRPPRNAKTCFGFDDAKTTLLCERWKASVATAGVATGGVVLTGAAVPFIAPVALYAMLASIVGFAATSPMTAYCAVRSETPLEDMDEEMKNAFLHAQNIKNVSVTTLQAAMLVAAVIENGKAPCESVIEKPAFAPTDQSMTHVEQEPQSISIAETFKDKVNTQQVTPAIEALHAKHQAVTMLLHKQFQQQIEDVNQKIPIETRIAAAEYRSTIAHEVAEKLTFEQIKQSGGVEQALPAIIQTIPASTLTNILYNMTVVLGLRPSRADDFDAKMSLYNLGKDTINDDCPQQQIGLEAGATAHATQAAEMPIQGASDNIATQKIFIPGMISGGTDQHKNNNTQVPEASVADKAVGGAVCVAAKVFGLETQAQQMDRQNREYREQVALQVFQEEMRYRDSHGLRTLDEARVHMQQEFQHKQLQQKIDLEKQQAIQNQQIIKTFETQTKPKQFDLYVDAKSIAETELKYCMQINDAKRACEAVQKMQHIAEGIAEDLVRADPKYKSICDKKGKMTPSERKLINEKKVEILNQLDAYAQEKSKIGQSNAVLMGNNDKKATPEKKAVAGQLKADSKLKEITNNSGGGKGPEKNDDNNAKKAAATALTAKAIKEAEKKAQELARKKAQQNIAKVSKKAAPNRTDISPDRVREALNNPELKKLEQQCTKVQKNNGQRPGTWEDTPGMNAQKYEKLELETTNKYEALCHTNTDVEKIASNTGISKETIKKVKDHVFNNEHIRLDHRTSQEVIGKFDTNVDMIQAWERLQSGNYMDADLELIKHEFAESLLMGNCQVEYSEAHQIADMFFNWFKSLKG